MYDILTIGAIKLDTFIHIPDADVNCKVRNCQLCLPYGRKNDVDRIDLQIAGTAPNVAIGVTKLGGKALVYSEMGKDPIHAMAKAFLKEYSIRTDYIYATPNRRSSFAAVLNYKGESTQLVAHDGKDFRLPKRLKRFHWLHLAEQGDGYERLYEDVIAYKKEHPIRISINPGTIQIKEKHPAFLSLLKHTEVLFVNKAEAIELLQTTQKTSMKTLLKDLHAKGPQQVVITDGRKGAYAFNGEKAYYAPMFPGDRVEATGAGDSFSTGYIGAILHKNTAQEGLAWGSVNAASVVQYIGPTKGLLTKEELETMLHEEKSYSVEDYFSL